MRGSTQIFGQFALQADFTPDKGPISPIDHPAVEQLIDGLGHRVGQLGHRKVDSQRPERLVETCCGRADRDPGPERRVTAAVRGSGSPAGRRPVASRRGGSRGHGAGGCRRQPEPRSGRLRGLGSPCWRIARRLALNRPSSVRWRAIAGGGTAPRSIAVSPSRSASLAASVVHEAPAPVSRWRSGRGWLRSVTRIRASGSAWVPTELAVEGNVAAKPAEGKRNGRDQRRGCDARPHVLARPAPTHEIDPRDRPTKTSPHQFFRSLRPPEQRDRIHLLPRQDAREP